MAVNPFRLMDRIDRSRDVSPIFIYKSLRRAVQEQSSTGAKLFCGALRPRGV